MIAWELLVVLVLIVLNGFFAMSELAVVSARKARLESLAEGGSRGARVALELTSEPGRFLSAVQIGITLIGIFAGAFGGATLAEPLAAYLATFPYLAPVSEELAFGLVVAGITYLSLIIGELVPKQLALRDAERIAALVARPMRLLAWLAAPVVFLLDASSKAVLRLLGERAAPRETVTEEEIRRLIAEATRAGIVEPAENAMITGVMRLPDRPVRAIMTPRPDIVWLDPDDSPEEIVRTLREAPYSRFPVRKGDTDEILGVVHAKDLMNRALDGRPLDLGAVLHEVPVVRDGARALDVLEALKTSPDHMAIVVDEYGSLEGLVTITDILGLVVAGLDEQGAEGEPGVVRRDDGSWLMDGGLSADEAKDLLGLKELPHEGDYHTLAGFVLSQLNRIPAVGDGFEWGGHRFEVVDMDGRRIDKVLVSKLAPPTEGQAGPEG